MSVTHTTRRIIGDAPDYRIALLAVTPKDRLKTETIRGCSPLDALVTFCDRHSWRIRLRGMPFGEPPSMHATIHACGMSTESVKVVVAPVNVVRLPLRCGKNSIKYEGYYRITLEG
jgi:hypothetical protein